MEWDGMNLHFNSGHNCMSKKEKEKGGILETCIISKIVSRLRSRFKEPQSSS